MTDLDARELAKLLAPLSEAVGASFAVDDRAGTEVLAVGDGEAGPERAPIVVRAEPIGSVRSTTPAAACGAARLLGEVLGRRQFMRAELESLATELLDRYEEVTLLHGLSRALGSVFDVPTVSRIALEKLLQVVPARRALVAVKDEQGDALVVTAAHGPGLDGWLGRELSPRGLSAEIVATRRRAIVHDDEPWREGDRPERDPGDALLSVPLLVTAPDGDDVAIGALTLAGRGPSEWFSAGDGSLAGAVASQLASTIQTSRSVDQLAAARNLRRELEIAADIQRTLLPGAPPDVPGAQVGARCVPAADVGGDFYDLITAPDGRIFMLVADVAGHGIGSALMMAMARAVLRRDIDDGRSPAAVLAATNHALFDDLANVGLFITLYCAVYDPATRVLRYACGGHPPALLVRAGGLVEELQADGMPAGILPDAPFEERETVLEAGDALMLYTDGVMEARGGGGQFGEERLHELVATAHGASPEELIVRVMGAVHRHTGGVPPRDDSTLVVLTVQPAPGPDAGSGAGGAR